MTTPVVSSIALLRGGAGNKSKASARRTYRTKTSFVAVHFDETGRGNIVFLPEGAALRVTGPSSCLPEGSEVTFERRTYNVFEIDLVQRSILVFETIGAKRRALATYA